MRGSGTVVQDNRTKNWMFLWWESGKRKSKSLGKHPTKTAAWKAAKPLRDALETKPKTNNTGTTVNTLIENYRAEKMPQRASTRSGYESWFENHIVPKWGSAPLKIATCKRDR